MKYHRSLVLTLLALSVAVITGCNRGSSSGNSENQPSSNPQTIQDTTPPAAPASLTAIPAGKHAVSLNWPDANPADGVVSFTIVRDGVSTGTASWSEYMDMGLEAGSTHDWIVYAQDASGNVSAPSPLASATTSFGAVEPVLVEALGYVVLAGNSIMSVGDTMLWGQVGTSPGTSISGFPPGQIFGGPAHQNDASAMAAMAEAQTAATFVALQEADFNVSGEDLTGQTLAPGVYQFDGSAILSGPGAMTLDGQGDSEAVWIFKVAVDLFVTAAPEIQYINGASVFNVYWQVGGSAIIDAATYLEGTIFADDSIGIGTGGGVIGRTMALGGDVTLDAATLYLVPTAPVDLGTVSEFAVLAGSEVQNVGATVLNGDLGVSPGSGMFGFAPGTVNGSIHLNDGTAIAAASDLVIASADAGSRVVDFDFTGIDLGGRTLASGQYWINGTATADGSLGDIVLDARNDPKAIWIFMISADLLVSPGTKIVLARGAKAANVFWQVSGAATVGAGADLKGSIMADGLVTLEPGVNLDGRACSILSAVNMNDDVVSKP